jgi:endoglycosylceramidase
MVRFVLKHAYIVRATFLKEGQPKQKFPYPIDDPYTVDESGVPSDADCARYDWSTYYFTEATGTAFQALYNNTAGIQDAFANFWKIIATEFRDIPNVIGYELINEPFAGDVIHRPDLILPGIADKVNLQPLYERISNDIRKIDTKKLIFFEPTTWSDFGSGFTQTPGGPEFQNRTVLAYHHYIPPDLSLEQSFMARMNDLNKLGCGGMLTEYDSSDNVNVWNETKRLIDFCNKLKQSWIGWEYKPLVPITGWGWGLWGQNGTFNTDLAKILSQTYAQRVCGQIALQYFDTETARYTLRYSLIPKCTAPTIIYTNEKLHYPKGYFVTVINGTWKQVAKKYIHVQPDGKGDVLVNLSRN